MHPGVKTIHNNIHLVIVMEVTISSLIASDAIRRYISISILKSFITTKDINSFESRRFLLVCASFSWGAYLWFSFLVRLSAAIRKVNPKGCDVAREARHKSGRPAQLAQFVIGVHTTLCLHADDLTPPKPTTIRHLNARPYASQIHDHALANRTSINHQYRGWFVTKYSPFYRPNSRL